LDRSGFDETEHDVFDCEANQNNGEKASEHFRDIELIFALEDVPAKPALAR
jgi:hypothetical protein